MMAVEEASLEFRPARASAHGPVERFPQAVGEHATRHTGFYLDAPNRGGSELAILSPLMQVRLALLLYV